MRVTGQPRSLVVLVREWIPSSGEPFRAEDHQAQTVAWEGLLTARTSDKDPSYEL